MAKLRVVRQADGQTVGVYPDGRRVHLSTEELRNASPRSVQNTQGVTGKERTLFMLTNSPKEGRAHLEKIGYEVRPLPESFGAWNFAVRKSTEAPWQVIDPRGPDMGDFLDLVGDAIGAVGTGVGATIGSAAGPVGTAVGAGIGNAAADLVRQGIAPGETDYSQTAMAGVVGAASVPVAAGAGMALRAVGRGALATTRALGTAGNVLATRFAGVKAGAGMAPEGVNLARARIPGFRRLPDATQGARRFLRSFLPLTDDVFPEKQQATQILKDLEQAGTTVDVRGVLERLNRVASGVVAKAPRRAGDVVDFGGVGATRTVQGPAATVSEGVRGGGGAVARKARFARPGIEKEASSILESLDAEVLKQHPLGRVPIRVANEMKEFLQKRMEGAYDIVEGTAKDNPLSTLLKDTARSTRFAVERAAGLAGHPEYTPTMRALAKRTRNLFAIRRVIGVGLDERALTKRTASFLEHIYGRTNRSYLDALADVETQFGLVPETLTKPAYLASIGKAFGFEGRPQLLGPLTAGGSIRGPAFLGGVIGGVGAGVPGFFAGAAAGGVLGSPVVLLGLTKAGLRVGSALTGMEAKMSALAMTAEARAAGIAAIRSSATPMVDAAVVRERAPKRKQVFIGQF